MFNSKCEALLAVVMGLQWPFDAMWMGVGVGAVAMCPVWQQSNLRTFARHTYKTHTGNKHNRQAGTPTSVQHAHKHAQELVGTTEYTATAYWNRQTESAPKSFGPDIGHRPATHLPVFLYSLENSILNHLWLPWIQLVLKGCFPVTSLCCFQLGLNS